MMIVEFVFTLADFRSDIPIDVKLRNALTFMIIRKRNL